MGGVAGAHGWGLLGSAGRGVNGPEGSRGGWFRSPDDDVAADGQVQAVADGPPAGVGADQQPPGGGAVDQVHPLDAAVRGRLAEPAAGRSGWVSAAGMAMPTPGIGW